MNIIDANIDAMFNILRSSVQDNKLAKSMHWFYELKRYESRIYFNLPIGPFTMQNQDSYILNYHGFVSQFGFRKIRDGVSLTITDSLMNALMNDLKKDPITGNEIDVKGNYLDLFMADMVSNSMRAIDKESFYVITLPQFRDLLRITRAKYDLLDSDPVVFVSGDMNEALIYASTHGSILLSPFEFNKANIDEALLSSKILNGIHTTKAIPTVAVMNDHDIASLRIGLTTWHMYVSSDFKVVIEGDQLKMNYTEMSDIESNFAFMTSKMM